MDDIQKLESALEDARLRHQLYHETGQCIGEGHDALIMDIARAEERLRAAQDEKGEREFNYREHAERELGNYELMCKGSLFRETLLARTRRACEALLWEGRKALRRGEDKLAYELACEARKEYGKRNIDPDDFDWEREEGDEEP